MEVTDTLRFFNGNKVSQWTKRGCQSEGSSNVVLVVYPVSHSLTLRAAIKSIQIPCRSPSPRGCRNPRPKKKLYEAF